MEMRKCGVRRRKDCLWLGVFFLTMFIFLVLPFGQAFGLVIDDFEGDMNFSLSSVGTTSQSYSGANVIGGTRVGSLNYLSGDNTLRASTTPLGAFNAYTFSEDSGVNGTGTISWSAGTPYDLTDGGSQSSFLFQWVMNDHPLAVTFRVTSGGAHADYVFNLNGTTPIQNLGVPFSSFSGVDMTSVTQLQILIPEGLPGVGNENDFSIGPITTEGGEPPPPPVPTFSEWGLIILALILVGTGVWFFGRRRNNMMGA